MPRFGYHSIFDERFSVPQLSCFGDAQGQAEDVSFSFWGVRTDLSSYGPSSECSFVSIGLFPDDERRPAAIKTTAWAPALRPFAISRYSCDWRHLLDAASSGKDMITILSISRFPSSTKGFSPATRRVPSNCRNTSMNRS